MPTPVGPWLETALAKGLIAPADAKAAAVPAGASEEKFQAELLKVARWAGWRPYHTFDSRRSAPGFPDLVLARVLPGRAPELIIAELKSRTGRYAAAQLWWLDFFELIPGARVRRWRPENWPEIEKELLDGWPGQK